MTTNQLKKLIRGKNRGNNVSQVFKKYFSTLKDKSILDVGCGYGSLTVEFAKLFKKVHAIDASDAELNATKKRIKEKKLKNVIVKKEDALNIKSTKEKFDVIHLSGVFEWLRAGSPNETAKVCQRRFLKNIKNQMTKNSILYSGTENRLFPYYWIKDPHFKFAPLLIIMPCWLSDMIIKIFKNEKYLPRMYSYWGLKKLFKKEFKTVDFYVPIPRYQYVFEFANIKNRKEIIRKCHKALKNKKLSLKDKLTIIWIKWSARLFLIKLLTPGFLTVAKK